MEQDRSNVLRARTMFGPFSERRDERNRFLFLRGFWVEKHDRIEGRRENASVVVDRILSSTRPTRALLDRASNCGFGHEAFDLSSPRMDECRRSENHLTFDVFVRTSKRSNRKRAGRRIPHANEWEACTRNRPTGPSQRNDVRASNIRFQFLRVSNPDSFRQRIAKREVVQTLFPSKKSFHDFFRFVALRWVLTSRTFELEPKENKKKTKIRSEGPSRPPHPRRSLPPGARMYVHPLEPRGTRGRNASRRTSRSFEGFVYASKGILSGRKKASFRTKGIRSARKQLSFEDESVFEVSLRRRKKRR